MDVYNSYKICKHINKQRFHTQQSQYNEVSWKVIMPNWGNLFYIFFRQLSSKTACPRYSLCSKCCSTVNVIVAYVTSLLFVSFLTIFGPLSIIKHTFYDTFNNIICMQIRLGSLIMQIIGKWTSKMVPIDCIRKLFKIIKIVIILQVIRTHLWLNGRTLTATFTEAIVTHYIVISFYNFKKSFTKIRHLHHKAIWHFFFFLTGSIYLTFTDRDS